MAAELLAHGRQDLVGEVGLAPRREPRVQRGGQHRRRDALVDGGQRRPATLARVRDPSGEGGQLRDRRPAPPRSGRAARRPPRSPAATPRPPRWCRSRTGSTWARAAGWSRRRPRRVLQADVGAPDDVEALGVGGHEAVLDAVVHHLHEVPGAGGPAVQVAQLAGRRVAGAPGRALDVAGAGGDGAPAAGRGGPRCRPRRRSSGRSHARGRTRRRWCRCRRSGCPSGARASARSMSSR